MFSDLHVVECDEKSEDVMECQRIEQSPPQQSEYIGQCTHHVVYFSGVTNLTINLIYDNLKLNNSRINFFVKNAELPH